MICHKRPQETDRRKERVQKLFLDEVANNPSTHSEPSSALCHGTSPTPLLHLGKKATSGRPGLVH